MKQQAQGAASGNGGDPNGWGNSGGGYDTPNGILYVKFCASRYVGQNETTKRN
ncbi:MAG: hypothetical protein WA667_23540 [Candidatus Nitrosopolaris sp.]